MKRSILTSLGAILFFWMSSCGTSVSPLAPFGKSYDQFRSEQKSFSSAQGTMRYVDAGPRSGRPVLLLHGVPTSSWLYRRVIEDLSSRGHRVIAPDMLGYGSSDSPSGYEIYNEKNHATRLLSLMDHLGIQSWNHVCHDAGGLWTQALVEKAPQRLKTLTLLNSVLLDTGFNPPVKMEPGLVAKTAMAGYRNSITNPVMTGALFRQGLEDCNLTDEDLKGFRQPLLEGKTDSLYYFFSNTCNTLPDYRSALAGVGKQGTPVQVIWGKKDDMLKWSPQSAEVQELLKISSNNIHLLNTNHFLQEEQPGRLSELIHGFIE